MGLLDTYARTNVFPDAERRHRQGYASSSNWEYERSTRECYEVCLPRDCVSCASTHQLDVLTMTKIVYLPLAPVSLSSLLFFILLDFLKEESVRIGNHGVIRIEACQSCIL